MRDLEKQCKFYLQVALAEWACQGLQEIPVLTEKMEKTEKQAMLGHLVTLRLLVPSRRHQHVLTIARMPFYNL